jgi:cell division protein FtsZ
MDRHIFIGVGGGGCNFIRRNLTQPIAGADWIAADGNVKTFHQHPAPQKILLGSTILHNGETDLKPELGVQAAMEAKDSIAVALKGAKAVYIAVGLGGGTGTGAAPAIARIAKACGVPWVAALATMPFDFEGPKRQTNALRGLQWLQEWTDVTLKFGNEDLTRLTPSGHDFFDAFSRFDSLILIGSNCLRDLLTQNTTGSIEPVLKQIYFNPDRTLRLGQGFASGPERLSEALRLAAKPIVAEHPVEKTENIWAHALSPAGLSEKESGELKNTIQETYPNKANIHISQALTSHPGDALRLTLLGSAKIG